MGVAELKKKFIAEIEHSDGKQLNDIYDLFLHYVNGNQNEEEWDSLSDFQKSRLVKSMDNAMEGKSTPLSNVISDLK